jgi:AcrR family transcriptional regulator
MSRWQPDARGRLEQAALELFLERGFEQTTVAEIAQRAGLTERTFFRHFADKREVLFAGAGALQEFLVRAVAQAPDSATPIGAIAGALQAAAPLFAERGDYPRQRQAVIAANAELRERELIKLAALAAAMAGALRGRGVPESTASLAAEAGMAVFRIAFERWTAEDRQPDLPKLIRDSLDNLKAVTAGRAVTQAEYLCIGAFGLTIRFCRDEGCPDHDRSSGTPVTCRIRQPGSWSRQRGASMQRTPSAPTVAACAVCGGRTILSPGPSLMSPLAVWNTIWPRTQYSTFS